MMTVTTTRLRLALMLALVLLPASLGAIRGAVTNNAGTTDVIWQDPGDIASLDLVYGAGGRAHAPDPRGTFAFVKEDLQATSPKFDVDDANGVRWKVKLGQEPQSETAATRFLWAAGYFVDEDYFLSAIAVTGLPTLRRGQAFVSAGGIVHRARLERVIPELSKSGNWEWFDNPFVDRPEFNGLRVMMSFLNNWDLSTANNSVYDTALQRRYVVADVGASFGKTGNNLTRSKSVARDYASSPFIEDSTPGFIHFALHSRPFLLSIFNFRNYKARTRMEQVTQHIPRADAQWLGRRLAMLSAEQVRDGFRAGGYSPDEVEIYTQTMRKRIADLGAL